MTALLTNAWLWIEVVVWVLAALAFNLLVLPRMRTDRARRVVFAAVGLVITSTLTTFWSNDAVFAPTCSVSRSTLTVMGFATLALFAVQAGLFQLVGNTTRRGVLALTLSSIALAAVTTVAKDELISSTLCGPELIDFQF